MQKQGREAILEDMIDIALIRENPELVAEQSKQKGYVIDVKNILLLDDQKRALLKTAEKDRMERNAHTEEIKKTGKPSVDQITKGTELKNRIAETEKALLSTDIELQKLLKQVPNMPLSDVPVGTSEDDNIVAKEWGNKPAFDFEPSTHWQIAEARDWIDKDRAAKVAGSRFAYIKGDLVKLQFALMQFVVDTLSDEVVIKHIIDSNALKTSSRPFVPILPPMMIRTEVFEAMDRLEPRDDRYKLEDDDLWLQGSAEHTLGSMHMNEIVPADELPLRYVGYATSFRREAGTYGKDTEGIIRMHQFDKLEMEIFSTAEAGLGEHLLLVAIQEYLMQSLQIPYQLMMKCTGDIGKPNARGVDINAWMPGQNKYRETHTADYMTDYQARRLKTRVKILPDNTPQLVHTNDATAFALGRTMVAIIENHQNEDGSVGIPEALRSYLKGRAVL